MKLKILLCYVGFAGAALAQEAPISSIPWLSDSFEQPNPEIEQEAPSETAAIEDVAVSILSENQETSIGLLSSNISGIPVDFWKDSSLDEITSLFRSDVSSNIPAIQNLAYRIVLTQLLSPSGVDASEQLFLARIDFLLANGALDQADALMAISDLNNKSIFQRQFDIALLMQRAEQACLDMRNAPRMAPTLIARSFCLARLGNWQSAATTADVANALGIFDKDQIDLLLWFLDAEMFEGQPDIPAPSKLSPLTFVMRQATGHSNELRKLPLAYLHLFLLEKSVWKQRLYAVEHLVASQAIPIELLNQTYHESKPAASGGVWDRAGAVQALTKALSGGDTTKITTALLDLDKNFQKTDLFYAVSIIFGDRLADLSLFGEAEEIRKRIILISNKDRNFSDGFSNELAQALELSGQSANTKSAISDAFSAPETTLAITLSEYSSIGQAVLTAILSLKNFHELDNRHTFEALLLLRSAGFEFEAREIALQALALKPD